MLAPRSHTRLALLTPVPVTLEFVRETLGTQRQTLDLSGLRGTRSPLVQHLVAGPQTCGGELQLEPSAADLLLLWPLIFGGSWQPETSHLICTLAESIPDFDLILTRPSACDHYRGCKFVHARFVASRGRPVQLHLRIEALEQIIDDTCNLPAATGLEMPLGFHDAQVDLHGVPRECASFELVLENVALLDRFNQSLSRIDLPIVDRRMHIRCLLADPADAHALFAQHSVVGSARLRLASQQHAVELHFPHVRFGVPERDDARSASFALTGNPGALPPSAEVVAVHLV